MLQVLVTRNTLQFVGDNLLDFLLGCLKRQRKLKRPRKKKQKRKRKRIKKTIRKKTAKRKTREELMDGLEK